MTPASPAWTVIGLVLTCGAVALLARRYRRGDGPSLWLAVTAAAWGIAFAVQGVGAGAMTAAVIQLTLGDLIALLGLPALGLALLRLAQAANASASVRLDSINRSRGSGQVTDGALLALAGFSAGWIGVLRGAYHSAGIGSAPFVVYLIHPGADLALLAATLWLAVQAGRRGIAPFLAVCAATAGDMLAVQARASGAHPGTWPQVVWLAAIALLGLSTLVRRQAATAPAPAAHRTAEPPLSTLIALAAAGMAAAAWLVYGIVTWGRGTTIPVIVASVIIAVLILRLTGLLQQAAVMSAVAAEAQTQFRQLADRTSDMVLICDAAGSIGYVGTAVDRYGYAPDALTGRQLADLVHPDDRPAALAAAAAARRDGDSAPQSLACRVRAADGTWRHVQASLSRYAAAPGSELLLVTARDVSDQVALRQQVTHLTFHDGLTGLPNRSYLEERAKDLLGRRPVEADSPGAIFVDLDGFTDINDSVGHGAGDLVLAEAGRRLRAIVPAHDTVARWGGDEFAVLIESPGGPQALVDVAERLAGAIAAEPFEVAGRELSITASIGVAFDAQDGAEHLLRNADLAMATAKDAGGGRVEVFAAHMHADVIRRLELSSDLRTAIEEGSLGIEYQPVVELSTARIASVEALVRWNRAGENVSPAEFLRIADDSGLIVPLGAWVLGEACRQVARWREADLPIGLSVNFSLRQVRAAGFAGDVLAALADSGLPPSALTLEVTERVLIEIDQATMADLARLRQQGARLAIDDFGTGYASLAYLRELPVDIIKIDPSFIAGLGTDGTLAMLTRTIVGVGHDLGIEIVAEGIERPEQLELLRAMGCGLGQGFLVAAPMGPDGIEALAAERARLRPADTELLAGEVEGLDGGLAGPAASGPRGVPGPDDRQGPGGGVGSAADAAAPAPAG